MGQYLFGVVKKIVPSSIRKYINFKMQRRRVNSMCNSGFPGFVILMPYEDSIKIDRVFNGIRYYSQVYQDYYLDRYIFNGKENGVFLDVGANDPIQINNTYFFEHNRKWSGLAFEPMPKMNQRWKELREVECIQIALGCQSGEIEFCEYEDDSMSGVANEVDYNGKVVNKYTVKVETLANILKQYKITHVDFMTLDVEGAELDVLRGIDFDAVSIDYIVIENNKGVKKEKLIRDFLISHNYSLKAKLWIDEIWEKKHVGAYSEEKI